LLYDKLAEPPIPGTMLESLMLLVWKARQDIRLYETKAMLNAIMISNQPAKDELNKLLQESWDAYIDTLYPYSKGKSKTQDQKAIEFMQQEIKRGPLKVTPLEPLTKAGKRRQRSMHRE
jgi:ABC-type enterochelin transport system ATPase subunit